MRKHRWWGLCFLIVIFTAGCVAVPKDSARLSVRVTDGINRLQEQTEAIIKTVGNIERGILDEKWEEIYRKTEEAYRRKKSLATDAALSAEDRLNIATNAAAVREKILSEIAATEDKLIKTSRSNTASVVGMNEEVTKYLLSIQKLDEANKAMMDLLKQVSGVDVRELLGKAKNSVGKLSNE